MPCERRICASSERSTARMAAEALATGGTTVLFHLGRAATRGQCGILIPSQRKQYQQRGASLAHCNFAVSPNRTLYTLYLCCTRWRQGFHYHHLHKASLVVDGIWGMFSHR